MYLLCFSSHIVYMMTSLAQDKMHLVTRAKTVSSPRLNNFLSFIQTDFYIDLQSKTNLQKIKKGNV